MRCTRSSVCAFAIVLAACGSGTDNEVDTSYDEVEETREAIGTLVGFKASMGFGDAADGVVDDMDFGGVLVLELEDGTEVDAVAGQEIVDGELTGGARYLIEFDEVTETWRVIEQLEAAPSP